MQSELNAFKCLPVKAAGQLRGWLFVGVPKTDTLKAIN